MYISQIFTVLFALAQSTVEHGRLVLLCLSLMHPSQLFGFVDCLAVWQLEWSVLGPMTMKVPKIWRYIERKQQLFR